MYFLSLISRRKHLKSTFPSMMESYMSADELSKHLGRQMSIEAKRCQEPEGEIIETDAVSCQSGLS